MASHTRPLAPEAAMPPRPRVDADGVRTFTTPPRRKAMWLIALAIAVPIVATIVAVAVIRLAPAPPSIAREAAAPEPVTDQVAEPARQHAVAPPSAPAPRQKLTARRLVAADSSTVDGAPAAPKRERKKKPDLGAAEVIMALRAEGETGGIAAFPLPGTKPIKSGIIVPEELELPDGYVRHYQTTDDGKQLPAILMFHPDYQFVNEHGEAVEVPADGIVPESMVPAGMPIERLETPQGAATAPAP